MNRIAYILDASSIFHKSWSQLTAIYRGAYVSDAQQVNTALKQLRTRLEGYVRDLDEWRLQGMDVRLIAGLDRGDTWRHDAYPLYKAKRPSKTKAQLEFFERALGALEDAGCELWYSPGYEADDVIATVATHPKLEGWEVRIIADDRDLWQLATERIKIVVTERDAKTKAYKTKVCDRVALEERLGYPVAKLPFMKALAGDPSDNYPGCHGVGDVGALPYVRQYENVKALYADLEHVAPKDRKKLEAAMDGNWNPELFERLATLSTGIPLVRHRTEVAV